MCPGSLIRTRKRRLPGNRKQSKLGRSARLRGKVEAMRPLAPPDPPRLTD